MRNLKVNALLRTLFASCQYVHEMEILGVNSRHDMMSLGIECTKFGGEAPKKFEGTCGAPIFFIPKFVLGN